MATEKEIAAHLDLSDRAVRDLKRNGVLPPAGRGEMDQGACRVAYIRHLRNGAAGRDSSRPGSLEAERARVAKEQADLLARKNATERGDIISRSAVDGAVTALVTIAMARLERVGITVARGDHKLRIRIEDAVHDAMRDLSTTTPEAIMAAAGSADLEESLDEEG